MIEATLEKSLMTIFHTSIISDCVLEFKWAICDVIHIPVIVSQATFNDLLYRHA